MNNIGGGGTTTTQPQTTRPTTSNKDYVQINDVRTSTQLKAYTFSNFKKTQVCDQITKNMMRGRIESACYWSAELICAGHFYELWEELIYFFGKHIHLGNPKVAIYLQRRWQYFEGIISQGHYISELLLRNDEQIRILFAEVVCVLALSNKKQSFEQIKIIRQEEFDINNLSERLKADSIEYIEDIFQEDDPKELIIAVNEFAYYLSGKNANMVNACFWLEWVIDFSAYCKTRKQNLKCDSRNYPVPYKFQKEPIWILWDVLFLYCNKLDGGGGGGVNTNKKNTVFQLLNATKTLFCIKYTAGVPKRRRHLLYFAVSCLTEPVSMNMDLVQNKDVVKTVIDGINMIYRQIKKNEISPNTDYLYDVIGGNSGSSNFEQTVEKLDMLSKLM